MPNFYSYFSNLMNHGTIIQGIFQRHDTHVTLAYVVLASVIGRLGTE